MSSTKKRSNPKKPEIKESIENVIENLKISTKDNEVEPTEVKTIKEKITKEASIMNDKNEKRSKKKVDLFLKEKMNLDEIFEYINKHDLNKKLKEFVQIFKKSVEENKFEQNYFQNLLNVIHNYKLVLGFLSYVKDLHKEADYEINIIFEIPKNLIELNPEIFANTKFDLNKKNSDPKSIRDVESIVLNDIHVEKQIPVIEMYQYLVNYVTKPVVQDIAQTIYISWLLCILHIKIFSKMIQELTPEERVEKIDCGGTQRLHYYEKQLDKFININNDTNVYVKNYVSALKKKTNKSVKKVENKQDKIVNQDISQIKDNNIHENSINFDDNDEINTNSTIPSNIDSFNLQLMKENSDIEDDNNNSSSDTDDEK